MEFLYYRYNIANLMYIIRSMLHMFDIILYYMPKNLTRYICIIKDQKKKGQNRVFISVFVRLGCPG